MGLRDWSRPPRQLLAAFVAVATVSAAAIGWLSWQLVVQDRAAEAQRRRDILDQVADRVLASMQGALSELPGTVAADVANLPAGVTAVSLGAAGTRVRPAGALLFVPTVPPAAAPPSSLFTPGERLEFVTGELRAALDAYSALARSPSTATRAAALLRVARVARKIRAPDEALSAYEQLAQLDPIDVDGWPAGLVARLGRLSLFEETNQTADRIREAEALAADLAGGRWAITRETWESALTAAREAGDPGAPADPVALTRAEAVSWLWNNRGEGSGRRALSLPTGPAIVLWTSRAGDLDVVVADRTWLSTIAADALVNDRSAADAVPSTVQWALANLEGQPLLGNAAPGRGAVTRNAAAAGLPWTLHVFHGDEAGVTSSARPVLLALIAVVAAVFVAGWYFLFRSLARERRVADMQNDFVAAVSHEFRTPLTTLSHAADLLSQNRLTSEEVKRQSYGVLVRETARLRSLVDGLLDFGRFGTHQSAFRFAVIDLAGIVRETVAAFEEMVAADGFRVEVRGAEDALPIRADREALTRALWNLLDNAVKYSPESRTVWVDLEREDDHVSISVRDRGLGIPVEEQQVIFDRFVRGTESKSRRIRGTGIGLAMVRKIAEAHHGSVTVQSVPGDGSRFTFTLQTKGTE